MSHLPLSEPAAKNSEHREVPEQSVDELRAEIAQLQDALDGRDVIGQAKGIIRLLTHTDSDTAFYVLAKISQDTNRKLRAVAALVSDCAAASAPLPADVRASWRTRTSQLAAGPAAGSGTDATAGGSQPENFGFGTG